MLLAWQFRVFGAVAYHNASDIAQPAESAGRSRGKGRRVVRQVDVIREKYIRVRVEWRNRDHHLAAMYCTTALTVTLTPITLLPCTALQPLRPRCDI